MENERQDSNMFNHKHLAFTAQNTVPIQNHYMRDNGENVQAQVIAKHDVGSQESSKC